MNTAEFKAWIEAQIEDEATPARVADWCRRNAGKPVRSNNVPIGFSVVKAYGMTSLASPDYGTTGGRSGHSFLLSYKTTSATVPEYTNGGIDYPKDGDAPRGLRELNGFVGREERNAQRRALLADTTLLIALLKAVNKTKSAVAAYRAAVSELQTLTGYGEPGGADGYAIADLAEVIKEERK